MSVIIEGTVSDSSAQNENGRIEFSQAQRFDDGYTLVTSSLAVAQVVDGSLKSLSGGVFTLPPNPDGTAVRVREMLGGQTFEWWTAIPNVSSVAYKDLQPVESSLVPDSVWGPPPWLAEVAAMRDETISAIEAGSEVAESLGGLAGIQDLISQAESAATASETSASQANGFSTQAEASAIRAENAANSIDMTELTSKIDSKVDKVSTSNRLYGTDPSGNQAVITRSTTATAGSVPVRGAGGVLPGVAAPASSTDATNKSYVDNLVAEALASITPGTSLVEEVRLPVELDMMFSSGPTGSKLTIPTHVSPSGGETTHPSVVYFPDGWNGYRYWMAHTPYPASNDTHEDPNICASHDGVKWVVPSGLVNPLDNAPGYPKYNSDTDLVFAMGKLWCFWRYQDTGAGATSQNIFVRTSTDGVTWTPKQLVQQSNNTIKQYNSPTFVFENGRWTMWAVDIAVSPYRMVRCVSNGDSPLLGKWGPETVCSVPAVSGRDLWHVEIKRVGQKLVGILSDCVAGQNGALGDLYLIDSVDGLTWRRGGSQLIPRTLAGQHTALYRSSFVPGYSEGRFGLHVWYPGWIPGATPVWSIFKTFVSEDTGWLPLSLSTGWDPVTNHTPRGRVKDRVLYLEGMVSRAQTTGDLTNIATIPSSLPLEGVKTVFVAAHVAKKGATIGSVDIHVDFTTRRIRGADYTSIDATAGWVFPIGGSTFADQR